MTDLATIRRRLEQYQNLNNDNPPRFLFRGQQTKYPSINSTFARIPENDIVIGQAYTVYRYAKHICQGLRGYTIGHLDGVAVLQHYAGWPTPLIDFTGTVEVAVFFSLERANAGSEAVIYVLDTQKLSEKAEIISHDFFTHTLDDGGLRHRWLRQDGFAVTTKEWRAATDSREFDLLAEPFCQAIEAHEFTVSENDCANIADVLSVTDDPIPKHLQNLLRIFCSYQFGEELEPQLADIIEQIGTQTSSTRLL